MTQTPPPIDEDIPAADEQPVQEEEDDVQKPIEQPPVVVEVEETEAHKRWAEQERRRFAVKEF